VASGTGSGIKSTVQGPSTELAAPFAFRPDQELMGMASSYLGGCRSDQFSAGPDHGWNGPAAAAAAAPLSVGSSSPANELRAGVVRNSESRIEAAWPAANTRGWEFWGSLDRGQRTALGRRGGAQPVTRHRSRNTIRLAIRDTLEQNMPDQAGQNARERADRPLAKPGCSPAAPARRFKAVRQAEA